MRGTRAAADADRLLAEIAGCRICAGRFAATPTSHAPRPVLRWAPEARILIAGQAPGTRVHASGLPYDDRSGDRLRAWMGLDRAAFYGPDVAIVPMGFCFPGQDAKGGDLPPPPVCAATWRRAVLARLTSVRLTLVIGQYALAWHLPERRRGGLTAAVADWAAHPPGLIVLPHPSWRNTGWLKRHPWFEAEVVPRLRARVAAELAS